MYLIDRESWIDDDEHFFQLNITCCGKQMTSREINRLLHSVQQEIIAEMQHNAGNSTEEGLD